MNTGSELERLKAQKDKLEREQKKLLQAHYADAIPLHLLKEEQERISKSLNKIVGQMAAYTDEYSQTIVNLDDALTLLEDCGKAYRLASDSERRCFNQALFKKLLVTDDLTVDAEYAEPFDALLNPEIFKKKTKKAKTCTNFFSAGLTMALMAWVVTFDTIDPPMHPIITRYAPVHRAYLHDYITHLPSGAKYCALSHDLHVIHVLFLLGAY